MSAPQLVTYEDVLDIVKTFIHANNATADQATIRYCCEAALRELVSVRDWKCMRKVWRVPLQTPQSTGTLTYSASGGAYPYLCTLVGATVPSWAVDGQIRIGTYSTVCDIDEIKSTTTFTLAPARVPAEDVTTATTYVMGKSWYVMPPECAAVWSPTERNAWYVGEYIPFDEWHLLEKYRSITGSVRRWTIGPAPNRYGTMALYVDPWSSSTSEYDMVLKYRPRQLNLSGQEAWSYAGTVTTTSGSTTVTGSSTSFTSSMDGAILRVSGSSTTKPTGTYGSNPYVWQQSILGVDTGTQTLTLGTAATSSLAGVKYTIADPLDIDIGIYDAFLANVKKQLAFSCNMENAAAIERQYQVALTYAKMADNMVRSSETAGGKRRIRTRLTDYNTT